MNRFKLMLSKHEKLKDNKYFSSLMTHQGPKSLRIGVFFDGTMNDQSVPDKFTNIFKLSTLYPQTLGSNLTGVTPSCRIYIRGVGTAPNELRAASDTATGWGGEERINGVVYAIVQFLERFKSLFGHHPQTVKFDIFGFSRGAALARNFVNAVLQNFFTSEFTTTYPLTMEIEFLGLFDTVASIGIPGNEKNPGYALHVPLDKIKTKTIHLVAEDELRDDYDLTSILSEPLFHSSRDYFSEKAEEIVCPGVHADIGGGYISGYEHGSSNNQLALYYLNLMRNKAIDCGVPFKIENPYKTDDKIDEYLSYILASYDFIDAPIFRTTCKYYRTLEVTKVAAPKIIKRNKIATKKLILSPVLTSISPSPMILKDIMIENIDLKLHMAKNIKSYLSLEVKAGTNIKLLEILKDKICVMSNEVGLEAGSTSNLHNMNFLDISKHFYSTYVHNSLDSDGIAVLPEVGRLTCTKKGASNSSTYETPIFRRMVFKVGPIKMVEKPPTVGTPEHLCVFNRFRPKESSTVDFTLLSDLQIQSSTQKLIQEAEADKYKPISREIDNLATKYNTRVSVTSKGLVRKLGTNILKTYKNIGVIYGIGLDKKTSLYELFKHSNKDFGWGELRNTSLINVSHLGSIAYKHPQNNNTIFEYNFLIETSDPWDKVDPSFFDMTRSLNGNFYYMELVSVKGEGPPLPDSYYEGNYEMPSMANSFVREKRCYVDSSMMSAALASAGYYSSYFDGEKLYGIPQNFVTNRYILGGQEYLDRKTQEKIEDMYGWLSFLAHGSKFWECVNACSGIGGRGQVRKGTVQTPYSLSQPTIQRNSPKTPPETHKAR